MNISDVKLQMIECCQRLWSRAYVANHNGNISYKLAEDRFLVTPTSFSKKDIQEADLLIVDGEGRVIEGKHKAFSEFKCHAMVYKCHSTVDAIVHAHPPMATTLSVSHQVIGPPALQEAVISLGKNIKTIESFNKEEIVFALNENYAFLVQGNGAWTFGKDPMQAYLRMEFLEELAHVHWHGKLTGDLKFPPKEEEKELKYIRELVQQELEKILSQEE